MKYFLGFLATIGLVVLVFILVIRGFSGGKPTKDRIVLADHVTSSMSVRMTVDGPVSADQNHVGYHIYVDRNIARIETYKGYQNTITNTKTYANNNEAYAQFLRALDLAGYTKGIEDQARADDRGQCASGNRYIYEIHDSPEGDKRYWSSTCGGGTFKGNSPNVRDLFQRQIPDFGTVTTGLDL